MQEGADFREFIYRVSETSQSNKKNRPRIRERLDTSILGMLSVFLGVVVLIIGSMAILNLGRRLESQLFGYSAALARYPIAVASIAAIAGASIWTGPRSNKMGNHLTDLRGWDDRISDRDGCNRV